MRTLLTILVAVALLSPLPARATDVSGPVSGVWNQAGSPYHVVGDTWVPADDTLIIMPGVEVQFYGTYKLSVLDNAILYAVGTKQDSILFSTPFHDEGWQGIRFLYANDASRLSYCRIEYGRAAGSGDDASGGAIFINVCSPTISHNHIDTCYAEGWGGGIYCDSSEATISNNYITLNETHTGNGGGVSCRYSHNINISDNTIKWNAAHEGGGINFYYCDNPVVSSNTIIGNSASYAHGGGIAFHHSGGTCSGNVVMFNVAERYAHGGGISCYHSSPLIEGNIISGNICDKWRGGGIECTQASPTITGNVITENNANNGGGISCDSYSGPTIRHNLIEGNSADVDGGGIWIYYYCPVILDSNIVRDNSANQDGGGIYVWSCTLTVANENVIAANSASRDGGGIYCNSASPSLTNNAVTDNRALFVGGGLYCNNSSPEVLNTIIWGDSARADSAIHLEGTSDPEVSYCDVEGGWEGEGNIDCAPEFVNPGSGNFHLQMTSCCIDAGDPDPQYNDPDGTRNDIGAFHFRQEPPAIVELVPHANCIVLPPEGGDIGYDAWIYNLSGSNIYVDVWVYAFVPGIGRYGPFHRYNNVRVRPGRSIGQNNLSKSVPAMAPSGEYSYVAYIGDFGGTIVDSSYFTFSKLGTPGGKQLGWLARGDWFGVDEFAFERETVLPADFALRQNYPNPFNARTTINYQLPVSNHVTLEVYNLIGQKLATLVDERQEAGYRSVIWDASSVSSGLYFYKLTAGDYTETRRMMLVK